MHTCAESPNGHDRGQLGVTALQNYLWIVWSGGSQGGRVHALEACVRPVQEDAVRSTLIVLADPPVSLLVMLTTRQLCVRRLVREEVSVA